jgi:hypothetical protein
MSETGCDSISEGNIEVLSLDKGTIANIKRDGGISTQTVEFELPALPGGVAATRSNPIGIPWPHKTYIKDMIIIPSGPIITAAALAIQNIVVQAGTSSIIGNPAAANLLRGIAVCQGALGRVPGQWGVAGAPAHLNVPLYLLKDGVGPGAANSFARASGGPVGGPNFSGNPRPGVHGPRENGTGEVVYVMVGTTAADTMAAGHAPITFKVIITFSE